MDTVEWDPQTDPHLPAQARYNSESVTQGKAAAKALFQLKHGLQQNPAILLVAFVGRLHAQKGVDVLLAALPHLLASSANAGKGRVLSCLLTLRRHVLYLLAQRVLTNMVTARWPYLVQVSLTSLCCPLLLAVDG